MKKNYKKIEVRIVALAVLLLMATYSQAQVFTYTYSYTGAAQTFTVPNCVNMITVDMRGAAGVTSSYGAGGLGGRLQANFTVTPAQVLNVYVGGQPFNGGGTGSSPAVSGGGASDIRSGGTALSNRILVAGGGGGAGGNFCSSGQTGGAGGGTTGGSGYYCGGQSSYYGTGGTQSAGGSQLGSCQSPAANGSLGIGGNGYSSTGGGGGGGYYGGGAGCYGGGGGGSSYAGAGSSSVVHTQGYQSGNGVVIISYTVDAGLIASVSPTRICNSSSATLTAGGTLVSYTWTTGSATNVISNASAVVVSPSVNTVYSVAATNSLGCTTTSVLSIAVDATVPTLVVANSTSATSNGVCTGRSATLTASGALSYTWTGGVTNGVSFIPSAATVYTVSGSNACGTSTAATSISIHPTPTLVTVASTSSLCSGTSLTLTASSTGTVTVPSPNFAWSHGYANGAGFFPITTAQYTVIGTTALGCTAQAVSQVVTVVLTPTAFPVATPPNICIGATSTLSSSGAAGYTWTSSYGTSTLQTYPITPTATGVVTFTLIKANSNCVDTKTVNLTVNPLPSVVAINSPSVSCSGKPVTLTAFGASTYSWAPLGPTNTPLSNATVSPVSLSGTAAITFTLAGSDVNTGCSNSYTFIQIVNPNPTVIITPASPTVCAGKCTTLTLGGAITYTWANPSLTSTPVQQVCPPSSTNYSVIGQNVYSCTNIAQQVIVVHNNPTLTTTSSPSLVCINGTSTISAGPLNQGISFAWSNSSQLYSTTVNPPITTDYTVTGTYTNTGCNSTKTVQVQVYQPTLSITGPTSSCAGGTITLTGNVVNPVGNQPYMWNGNYNFQQLSVSPPGPTVYVLTATSGINGLACVASKNVTITIYANPTITAATERTLVCKDEENHLYGGGGSTYVWTAPNMGPTPGTTVSVFPTAQVTTYTVVGTDANGCVGKTTILVRLSTCSAINENGLQQIVVYPNPNNGEFTIASDEAVELSLVNQLGQTVKRISITDNKEVSVSGLPGGVYFITGVSHGKQINHKIIIAD